MSVQGINAAPPSSKHPRGYLLMPKTEGGVPAPQPHWEWEIASPEKKRLTN